jgi:hypothetical protein
MNFDLGLFLFYFCLINKRNLELLIFEFETSLILI